MPNEEVKKSYCIKIPIENRPYIIDKLGVMFDTAHDLYNESVAQIKRNLAELDAIEEYKESQVKGDELYRKVKEMEENEETESKEYKALKKECESYYNIVRKYQEERGISKSGMTIQSKIVVPAKHSNPKKFSIIPSPFYSGISNDIAKSVEKFMYKKGEIHYKSRRMGTTVTCLTGKRIRTSTNSFSGIVFGYNHSQKMFYIKVSNIKVKDKMTGKERDAIIPLNVYNNSAESTRYILKNLAYAFDIPFVPKNNAELNMFLEELNRKMIENKYNYLTFPKIGPCSLVYERIRGVNRYYLTVNIDGTPFNKYGLDAISDAKDNVVGIDLGTQTVALSFRDKTGKVFKVDLFEFVEEVDNAYIGRMSEVSRAMDRSRRVNNPENYNEDGTPKRGKRDWVISQNYTDLKDKNATMGRNMRVYSKVSHAQLVKYIMNYAHNVVIEPMDYSALQKRAKETTYRTVVVDGKEVQRANKKARFGKSVLKKSPALFVNMLKEAVKEVGGQFINASKFETRASQYNHQTDECKKKTLNTRWNDNLYYMGKEVKIQRDLYSAFLLSNMNFDTKKINKELCDIGFDEFVVQHDKCLERLKGAESAALRNILK